ncbi:hypothetical protein NOCA2150033 [metagenome]|uniref:Uncharacterized protein n=1 Tax=metagenome TaxID=256318 RepID=A0A2P2BX17_9ZZZZ
MPRFQDPVREAAQAREALRCLAHSTRAIDDPRQIYSVLGSLSAGGSSLEQSLPQLAAFHDGAAQTRTWTTDVDVASRAAAHKVSWELHRAGEELRQVSAPLEHAHEVAASIAYVRQDSALAAATPPTTRNPGVSL